MELLLQNIAEHVVLTPEEQAIIEESFKKEYYPAKKVLLNVGDVCDRHIFVLSGVLRIYKIDENAVEHTLSFASRGRWMSDLRSLFFCTPCELVIEVLEETTALTLKRDKQLELFDSIPKIERYFRIITENAVVANQQRVVENMYSPAEQRYDNFLERFPDIKLYLPQRKIASYIGITPEFFSRMKRKALKKSKKKTTQ